MQTSGDSHHSISRIVTLCYGAVGLNGSAESTLRAWQDILNGQLHEACLCELERCLATNADPAESARLCQRLHETIEAANETKGREIAVTALGEMLSNISSVEHGRLHGQMVQTLAATHLVLLSQMRGLASPELGERIAAAFRIALMAAMTDYRQETHPLVDDFAGNLRGTPPNSPKRLHDWLTDTEKAAASLCDARVTMAICSLRHLVSVLLVKVPGATFGVPEFQVTGLAFPTMPSAGQSSMPFGNGDKSRFMRLAFDLIPNGTSQCIPHPNMWIAFDADWQTGVLESLQHVRIPREYDVVWRVVECAGHQRVLRGRSGQAAFEAGLIGVVRRIKFSQRIAVTAAVINDTRRTLDRVEGLLDPNEERGPKLLALAEDRDVEILIVSRPNYDEVKRRATRLLDSLGAQVIPTDSVEDVVKLGVNHRRGRVGNTSIVIAAALVLITVGWKFSTLPTAKPPDSRNLAHPTNSFVTPPRIEQLELYIGRNKHGQKEIPLEECDRVTLIESSTALSINYRSSSFRPLRETDPIFLKGQFDNPTIWYSVLIDAAGEVEIVGSSNGGEASIRFENGSFRTIGDTPSGGNVLLVVAATELTANKGLTARKTVLEEKLRRLPRPPSEPRDTRASKASGFAISPPFDEYKDRLKKQLGSDFRLMSAVHLKNGPGYDKQGDY